MFYEIELPIHFGVEHALGIVLGRASYGDNLYVYQNCTIGVNVKDRPILGNNIIMYAGSKIIGNSKIGDNVILAANSVIVNKNIPDNSIVFNQGNLIVIKELTKELKAKHFNFHFNVWDQE